MLYSIIHSIIVIVLYRYDVIVWTKWYQLLSIPVALVIVPGRLDISLVITPFHLVSAYVLLIFCSCFVFVFLTDAFCSLLRMLSHFLTLGHILNTFQEYTPQVGLHSSFTLHFHILFSAFLCPQGESVYSLCLQTWVRSCLWLHSWSTLQRHLPFLFASGGPVT